MAKIRIEIDTISGDSNGESRSLLPLAADKVGLLSSVPLSKELIDAFEEGLGVTGIDKENPSDYNYDESKIKDGKEKLKTRNCKVVATVGGFVAFDAIKNDAGNPRFVSLLANVPTDMGNNGRGGVSLESYKMNRTRKDYLKGLGHADGDIYLLTNKNSKMHAREKQSWNMDATFKESLAGGTAGNNEPSQFASDFSGGAATIPSTATAVIISDDPFFQASRKELITAVNGWLAGGADRHVVYPSKMYESAPDGVRPTVGKSTLVGPDLKNAYRLLGVLAGYLVHNPGKSVGFFPIASEIHPVT